MKNKILGEPIVNSIIGKTEDEGRIILVTNGYTMRIINVDGSPKMATTEINEKRVNVFITNGFISDIDRIG